MSWSRVDDDQIALPGIEGLSSSIQRQISADAATIPQRRKNNNHRRISWSEVVPIKTFLCPISGRLLMDPVLTSDGHTYEKEEIETWFSSGARSSPLTGKPLPHTQTIRNHALRNAIAEYMSRLKNQKTFFEQKTVRETVEVNAEKEQRLQNEVDALRIEVATANADLERATNDLAFLERTFQERAVTARVDDLRGGGGGGGVWVGSSRTSSSSSSFVDGLPPWLRRIASIGARLEKSLSARDGEFPSLDSPKSGGGGGGGDWEPKSPLSPPSPWSPKSSRSGAPSPKSPKSPKSPTKHVGGRGAGGGGGGGGSGASEGSAGGGKLSGIVSDASLAALALLVEEELEQLAAEAVRRALRRRQMMELIADRSEDAVLTPLQLDEAAVAARERSGAGGAAEDEVSSASSSASSADFDSAEARERRAEMRASELEAFSSLYAACNGPEWEKQQGWGSDPEYGRWYGVAVFGVSTTNGIAHTVGGGGGGGGVGGGGSVDVDRAYSAAELILPSNRLEGTLPHQIGFLQNITTLDLSNNQIAGTLPLSLGSLGALQTLNLKDNEFSGPVAVVDELSKISSLNLSWNNFSGRLPELKKGRLTARVVDLAGNRLHGSIPESYGNLVELRTLWLHFNRLSGPIPSTIAHARKLRHLGLFENKLNGRLPAELGTLVGLRKLLCSSNKMTGRLPWELCNLTNLTELSLQNNLFVKDTDVAKTRRSKQLPACRILL